MGRKMGVIIYSYNNSNPTGSNADALANGIGTLWS